MAARVRGLRCGLALAILLAAAGCAPSPEETSAQAEAVAREYFSSLSEGRFADAAAVYGGNFEELSAINPDLDPLDQAGLLERWCRQNGGVCLPIREVVSRDVLEDGAIRLRVQFSNPDGSLFEIGPCCGEVDTGQRTNEFDYVVRSVDGDLRVLQLPPFVP